MGGVGVYNIISYNPINVSISQLLFPNVMKNNQQFGRPIYSFQNKTIFSNSNPSSQDYYIMNSTNDGLTFIKVIDTKDPVCSFSSNYILCSYEISFFGKFNENNGEINDKTNIEDVDDINLNLCVKNVLSFFI